MLSLCGIGTNYRPRKAIRENALCLSHDKLNVKIRKIHNYIYALNRRFQVKAITIR